MPQLVFLHGPGAGACADAYYYQLRHFSGSVAPTLPGHIEGAPCADVARYSDWVRGWLWAQGLNWDLVLVGYTLGAAIALQYGLDYPDEVKGLILMTVAARPKEFRAHEFELRRKAASDPAAYAHWMGFQRNALKYVDPGLRERLLERHRQIGPLSQLHDMNTICAFDVRDRLAMLQPRLLLMHGLNDPNNALEYEREIHEAVPASEYLRLEGAGHFPATEIPDRVNALIEKFVATL